MRAVSVVGSMGRTIIARLQPGTDMLDGIQEVCRRHGVKYGFVSCAVGCFSGAAFVCPMPKADAKIGIVYGDPIKLAGPVEFLGGQGVVCQSEEGNYLIHFHGSLSDTDLRVWGGHFLAGGNVVLATLDCVIQEVCGVEMLRKFEDETGFVQFCPKKMEG
jgi:predicted DNA-binding protein with PD1-like motif